MRSIALLMIVALQVAHAHPASAKCVGFLLKDATGSDSCASEQSKAPEGSGETFEVGPDRANKDLGDVPWSRLKAGDTVRIHHRVEPYREKILISARGTPEQWVRVLGVPGPNGELPIISGDNAITSKNALYRWNKPDLIEWLGVLQIAAGPDTESEPRRLPPAYIEIANLQIQDGFSSYKFQASNGAWLNYNGFAACIYARSVNHLVVRNTVLTNCGQGFYNWTGEGSSPEWWAALQSNTILSGNYFYNNGNPGSYLEHQSYTESDRVTIEYNRFGQQRSGARGSQIKDRSVGTVIRYNWIEQSLEGWDMDLVEPEASRHAVGQKPEFSQTFVYGNAIRSRGVAYPNIVHWNEDQQGSRGRATKPDGRLFFYHNTIAIVPDRDGAEYFSIFNATWGGYDCADPAPLGKIDARNNIIAVMPPSSWQRSPPIRLGYCKHENVQLGPNWISPGALRDKNVEGWQHALSQSGNDPGFASVEDFALKEGATAAGAGGELAAEVTANHIGANLSPIYRMIGMDKLGMREKIGVGSDLGAY